MTPLARLLFPGVLAAGLALLGLGRTAGPPPPAHSPPAVAPADRGVVYLAGGLPDEALLALGALVAPRAEAVLLIDSPTATPYLRHFLSEYRPARVVPIGTFEGGRAALEARLGVKVEAPRASAREELGRSQAFFVICPPTPRPLLLRAAWLAGLLQVPLWVSDGSGEDRARLAKLVRPFGAKIFPTLLLVGRVQPGIAPRVPEVVLKDADAIEAFAGGAIDPTAAVVANPHDTDASCGGMSTLAPWLAASRRARLLLTDAKGTNVPALVAHRELDTLTLMANLKAIPMERRPNPIPEDKDQAIEMEPLTPADGQPFRYAVGRLFHDDRAVVALMLARQRLIDSRPGPRRALVASNPGGGLGLLEAFSRNTAHELTNAGYQVHGLYGKELTAKALRKAMVGPDIILWEGHHNTLVKEWGFPSWDEPLPPALVFLQSCLALQEEKAQPLLTRGAVAVVGSSTRIYSGSGGAFALAYFNALLHDGQTLGGALRQAKNYMACYAALKQRRLGNQAGRVGANHRAAWSFTLWGDPTLRLARPATPAAALPGVRPEVVNGALVVHLPEKTYPRVTSGKYQVDMPPGARLAGLLRKASEGEAQSLVPLVFAEVALPGGPAGCEPRLRSRLAAGDWAFRWDARRQVGHLLAVPRPGAKALRFEVEWSATRVAARP